MTEIAKVARMARTAKTSYGRYVASGQAAAQAGNDDPVCADCPQCSHHGSAEGPARFCNYMNRPIDPRVRTSPVWCWLRTLRAT